jgi:exopolyphosphatase/guanosine-5'-triphosphate,3'-diphosphate pyrophosphatase
VRVAAVDLGTNSTRLLVADVVDGRLVEVSRRLRITRLGEGTDATGRLRDEAIGRVLAVLEEYREEVVALGAERTLATATSAVRDAANGGELLARIERELGFQTRLLSGAEEAAMMFRGVSTGADPGPETLLLDIGGGSTELVLGGPGGVSFSTSLQMGCVRLTERFVASDPPAADELEACAEHVRSLLPAIEPRRAIGVAGTVTTLASLDLGLEDYDSDRVHGHVLTTVAVERELARLAAMTVAERATLPNVERGRAEVIVAGAVILRETLHAYGLPEIVASERDILHGAALAAADPG